MFLVTDLIALLAANLILMQALGTSTLFIAAGSRRHLIGTALVITIFTTVGSACAYFVHRLIPQQYADFTLLSYTIIIGILYVLLLCGLYFFSPDNFGKYRRYIHISAYNCAVMGTLFTVTERAQLYPHLDTLKSWVIFGIKAGAGFVIAAFILTAAFRKLSSAKVPSAFRGFPAMLVYLGMISMAVYALK